MRISISRGDVVVHDESLLTGPVWTMKSMRGPTLELLGKVSVSLPLKPCQPARQPPRSSGSSDDSPPIPNRRLLEIPGNLVGLGCICTGHRSRLAHEADEATEATEDTEAATPPS